MCERGKIKIRKKKMAGGGKKEKNRLASGAQRRKEKIPRLPNLRATNNEEGKKKHWPQARREGKIYLPHARREGK